MTKTGQPQDNSILKDRFGPLSRYLLRRWLANNLWVLIGCAWLVAYWLGYAGFARFAANTGQQLTQWDLLYLTLQLIPMNSGAVVGPVVWELNAARFLIPLLTAFTAIQAFAVLFQQQTNLVRLRLIRDHYVICGLSHKGLLLATGFRDRRNRVVIIEKDVNNPYLEQCRIRGAIVLLGDAKDADILRKAGISRAKVVIAVCDNDGVNADIALTVRELVQERPRKTITCIIQIVDPQVYSLLREQEFEMEEGTAFRLELFNIYNLGANILLEELESAKNIRHADPQHLVVIGLGMMGENLVVNAARLMKENLGSRVKPLRITVVDRDARRKTDSLKVRYPQLEGVCELIPCEIEIHSGEFQSGHFLSESQDLSEVDGFCVCLDNDSLSLYTGLVLLQLTRMYDMPILVRLSEIAGLARYLNDGNDSPSNFKRLYLFGLLERTCTPDLVLGGTHELLAQSIHQEYIRQQMLFNTDLPQTDSMLPWEMLPEQLKESNRCQADRIGLKIKSVGCRIAPLTDWNPVLFEFTIGEIEVMAQLEHTAWANQLQSDGWVYEAGCKNTDHKTHPNLVSWVDLPETEKEKNRTNVREIPRFLARAGFQVERCRVVSQV